VIELSFGRMRAPQAEMPDADDAYGEFIPPVSEV